MASFKAERGAPMPSNLTDFPKLAYSIKEACRASSLGRSTLYAHISAGRLRAVRVGGRTVIPAESLRALIAGEA
jgi:excisionase family DNA binding protein